MKSKPRDGKTIHQISGAEVSRESSPVLLGTGNKSGSARPILGVGVYQYEAIHDWGELPAYIKYGNTHGVCEDSQGHIYVFHTVHPDSESPDCMVVFDCDGKFVKSWGRQYKHGAHGLCFCPSGNEEFLYLCDTQRSVVVKTTLDGEVVFTLGYPQDSEMYQNANKAASSIAYSPTNVAVAPNGDLYVADGYGSSYINQYSGNGEFIRTFSGAGPPDGQLSCPHGIIVDTRGERSVLLVADRANHRLQTFTLEGQHLGFVGGVNLPCHFCIFNELLVIPDLAARLTLMDQNNRVIAHLGEDLSDNWGELRQQPRERFTAGKFVCPHSACFDHEGNIFVVEWVGVGRVTKLRRLP